jgi:hypothetical protein
LFVGSTINAGKVAGTEVQMVQKTEYPWKPEVGIIVNPAAEREFTVYVRVPNRQTSELYTATPAVCGLKSISVNGRPVTPAIVHGYAVIRRVWKKGDRIDLELPMAVQKVVADPRVAADSGRVALRYGPLLYNVETADNASIDGQIGPEPLRLEWSDSLLGGVMTIRGHWADGTPLVAIPNYARMNRVSPTPTPKFDGRKPPVSQVWIKD